MANLIFTIVSLSVACILSCCSCPLISLHALAGIAVILLFQHTPAVQSNDIHLSLNFLMDLIKGLVFSLHSLATQKLASF